jgi:protein-S-isoprenylcysteine O-methyltransferase Ste14
MQLDVRVPIGLLFSALGVLLTVFGAISDRAIYQRSLGVNINLVWGVVMLAFGLAMLWLGRRHEASATKTRKHETKP